MTEEVQKFAPDTASFHWRQKKQKFALQLDGSMKHQGGKIPFALLKDQRLPPVRELFVSVEVKLVPQRWSPVGKAWIGVSNPHEIRVGDTLWTGDLEVKVLSLQDDKMQVNFMLSRRQAAGLHKTFVTADPSVWCPITSCGNGMLSGKGMRMRRNLIFVRISICCPISQRGLWNLCPLWIGSMRFQLPNLLQ